MAAFRRDKINARLILGFIQPFVAGNDNRARNTNCPSFWRLRAPSSRLSRLRREAAKRRPATMITIKIRITGTSAERLLFHFFFLFFLVSALKYIRPFLRVFVGRGGFHHPDGVLFWPLSERITAKHDERPAFCAACFPHVERVTTMRPAGSSTRRVSNSVFADHFRRSVFRLDRQIYQDGTLAGVRQSVYPLEPS